MRVHPFAAIVPELDLIASPDAFFGTVKLHYNEYTESGFFKKVNKAHHYICRITTKDHKHTGVVTCLDTKEFIEGNVLKHENILPAKAQISTELTLQRRAMIKPVLLTHPPIPGLKRLLKAIIDTEPVAYKVRFDEENMLHEYWRIPAEKVEAFEKICARELKKAYIADGHHRSSVACKLSKAKGAKSNNLVFDKVLCILLSFEELIIHDYNRVVEITDQISPLELMARLSEVAKITVLDHPMKPTRSGEVTMCLNKKWFLLKWKKKVWKEYKEAPAVLDVHLLNEKILEQICGIKDLTDRARIKYVEGVAGIEGLLEKVYKNQYRVAFCLYPVDFKTFKNIADHGEVLPPKSTWFEPRIKNGLIAHSLVKDA